MKNLTIYEQYFQQIVENYKLLKEFYHLDLFQFATFEQNLRSAKFKTPLLILESYNKDMFEGGKFNIHNSIKGALVILTNFNIRGLDAAKKTALLTDLELIIEQVMNRMLLDKQTNCHKMKGLVISSISISPTELIASSFKGFRMEFTIENIYKPELDANWQ